MTEEELRSFLGELGEKPFRADQIFRWMHRDLAASPEEMTNISKALREKLRENADYVTLKKADVRISKIDGTRKYLFALPDGNVIGIDFQPGCPECPARVKVVEVPNV